MTGRSSIYLVSCVGKKLATPAPAKDLYGSPWFKKARIYVESRNADWFILSAMYGVVHPKRQIKEGYEMTTILTDDGRTFSGYLTSERNGTVGLRDLATGKVREIPSETIEERVNKGTAMPSGFTNSLTRKELRDLISYLTSLKPGNDKSELERK